MWVIMNSWRYETIANDAPSSYDAVMMGAPQRRCRDLS